MLSYTESASQKLCDIQFKDFSIIWIPNFLMSIVENFLYKSYHILITHNRRSGNVFSPRFILFISKKVTFSTENFFPNLSHTQNLIEKSRTIKRFPQSAQNQEVQAENILIDVENFDIYMSETERNQEYKPL